MKEKGQAASWLAMLVVGVLVIAVGGMVVVNYAKEQGLVTGGALGDGGPVVQTESRCPDTGQTTLKVSYKNMLNDNSDERINVTAYVYENGVYDESITDTDSTPESITVNCNEYDVKVVGVSSNQAAASFEYTFPKSEIKGPAVSQKTIAGAQLSGLKARVWNNDEGAYANDNDSSTAFQNLNDTWGDTTDGSAVAIGADGTYDITLKLRTTSTDTQWSEQIDEGGNEDLESLICMDYEITKWQDPVLSIDGVELVEKTSDIHSRLTSDGIDKCWIIPEAIKGKSDTSIRVEGTTESGQNPSSDIVFYFILEGRYLSVDGETILSGTNKDDSSYTYVHTPEKLTYDIS